MKWKKFISLNDARKLSKLFCDYFNLPYCQIYFVDYIEESYGVYCYLTPQHALIEKDILNPIGILIHELTHHLEFINYCECNDLKLKFESQHGYYFQLAKKRVIKWAKENISKKADWNNPLKYKNTEENMKKFKL